MNHPSTKVKQNKKLFKKNHTEKDDRKMLEQIQKMFQQGASVPVPFVTTTANTDITALRYNVKYAVTDEMRHSNEEVRLRQDAEKEIKANLGSDYTITVQSRYDPAMKVTWYTLTGIQNPGHNPSYDYKAYAYMKMPMDTSAIWFNSTGI